MNRFHKKSTLYLLLLATVIMAIVMSISGAPLKTRETPSGIINLEFANTQQKVISILSAWENASTADVDVIAAAKKNTYFDFLFLLYYAFFLYSCCKQLALSLASKKNFSKWLNYFANLALLAGVLDFLENIGMLISLAEIGSDTIAFTTAAISISKWMLVVTVLVAIITGLATRILIQKKNG
jgi:hypothetical protein